MGMECSGYGYGYGYGRYGYGYGSKVWVWNAEGMGMGMGTMGMGMAGMGMECRYGYGMQRVMVGDMVWQAARRGSADRTVFASADHHCLGEEVRALNDFDAKQLDEKQMGSVIYLRRH